MSNVKDITGQKFGRLTALYRLHNYHDKNHTRWLCACDCGNLVEVQLSNLTNNHTTSCGCYYYKGYNKLDKVGRRIYNIWRGMKLRCCSIKSNRYKYYGRRGIKVCDEWKDNFQVFYDWALNNGYKEGLTIDRINVDGNYSPENCRFATIKQQARNKSNNRNFTINGETHCLSEWCEILGLNRNTVNTRLKRNWTIEKALELK